MSGSFMKFFNVLLVLALGCNVLFSMPAAAKSNSKPNIILMMADDLGYGDTGFNGSQIIQTPNLDNMAKEGTNFTHFYASGPVCSPTRGSFLTGRHYSRFGIFHANMGNLPKHEWTLAKMLKQQGYATGHFGKWHLGTLDKVISAKGPKRKPKENFAPPWLRDYDESFVTESAITTWNPGLGRRAINNPFYHNGKTLAPTDPVLKGGASRVVVDKAVPFIKEAVKNEQPFLAVIWFHAPHEDIEAGPEYLAKYPGHGEKAHYYGAVTELDDQVGRVRKLLKSLNVENETLVFFTSDNGPEVLGKSKRRAGETAGLRDRKRSLYEGGVRVPTVAVWPNKIPADQVNDKSMSTLDLLPTVEYLTSSTTPREIAIDGENVWPLVTNQTKKRSTAIPFFTNRLGTLVDKKWKLIAFPNGKRELFDLSKDHSESNNLIEKHPVLAERMFQKLKNKYFEFKTDFAHLPNKTTKWRHMPQFENGVKL